jgi:hypothetical protein
MRKIKADLHDGASAHRKRHQMLRASARTARANRVKRQMRASVFGDIRRPRRNADDTGLFVKSFAVTLAITFARASSASACKTCGTSAKKITVKHVKNFSRKTPAKAPRTDESGVNRANRS